jgi:hypothetical protein
MSLSQWDVPSKIKVIMVVVVVAAAAATLKE